MNELVHIGKIDTVDKSMWRSVYVAKSTSGAIKVGVTKNEKRRIKSLKAHGFGDISDFYKTPLCSNCFQVESRIQEQLRGRKIRGEWYSVCYEDAVAVVKHAFNLYAVKHIAKVETKAKYHCDTLLDYFEGKEVRINE